MRRSIAPPKGPRRLGRSRGLGAFPGLPRSGALLLAAALLVSTACRDSLFDLDPRDIVGVSGLYQATELQVGEDDVLAAGGSLMLRLRPGTSEVSGSLRMSGEGEVRSLSGSWEFDEEALTVSINLNQSDVFLNDLVFDWDPDRPTFLEAEETVEDTFYRVVLQQQES